jgi:hypothetical protein
MGQSSDRSDFDQIAKRRSNGQSGYPLSDKNARDAYQEEDGHSLYPRPEVGGARLDKSFDLLEDPIDETALAHQRQLSSPQALVFGLKSGLRILRSKALNSRDDRAAEPLTKWQQVIEAIHLWSVESELESQPSARLSYYSSIDLSGLNISAKQVITSLGSYWPMWLMERLYTLSLLSRTPLKEEIYSHIPSVFQFRRNRYYKEMLQYLLAKAHRQQGLGDARIPKGLARRNFASFVFEFDRHLLAIARPPT